VAAGSKPAEEFRFYNVERTEPGGARLWIRHGCESIDGCVAAGISGAESVGVAALSLDAEPVGIYDAKPVCVDDAAFFGEFGIKSDRPVGEPADSKCEHAPVISERQHETVQSKREHAAIVAEWRCQPLWIEL
jgi:hypothetical protein